MEGESKRGLTRIEQPDYRSFRFANRFFALTTHASDRDQQYPGKVKCPIGVYK
jgi:hypothetical protein